MDMALFGFRSTAARPLDILNNRHIIQIMGVRFRKLAQHHMIMKFTQ